MSKILIIDDERSIRRTLSEILEYENYQIESVASAVEGLEMIKANKYDLILSDIKMPQMDGLELLDHVSQLTDVPVVMISGHADVDTAIDAMKRGAHDLIEKPIDLNRLLLTIRNAMEKSHLVQETKILKRKVSKTYDMIGESPQIQQVKNMIDRVAEKDVRVLITGDNGTGKELVARWLHEKSPRVSQSFVEVNCAAIPSELIESELFGHEKGAFTSAHKQRKGKFEQANGGTLFLDEIGDMSLSAQAKVLRALQENKINRVGGDKDIKVNVRIVAATNKDLQKEIKENKFREDLYHRLSVILIKVPALRDRLDDIPLLAAHFNEQICTEYGLPLRKFSDDAISELKKLKWTGNIREFRNMVERLIILCGETIQAQDVIDYAIPNSRV